MTKKPYAAPSALRWLPLVLIVILGAAAWGQQKAKTDGHDRRIEQNEKTVRVLENGQATILERTKNIMDNQKAYQKESTETMREVLKELRRR